VIVGLFAVIAVGNDLSAEVPGLQRGDELGQMARTIEVFKNSMIEAERLREQTERNKAAAETERKTWISLRQ
jgi:methyl-accepting chemotaxis protein